MTIQTYPAPKSQVSSSFWRYTATGGETTLTGIDNAGVNLAYYPNQEQVYLNGIMLVRGVDYTATSGTSITGLSSLTAGDYIQVNCYSNFTITQIPVTSLQGPITNLQLANSSITIGGQTISLGGTQNTFSGITLTAPTINNQIAGTQYSTSVPLTVKGAVGQAVSTQEWQNSTGSILAKIDQSGNLGIGTSSLTTAANYASITLAGVSGTIMSSSINGTETFRIQPTATATYINQISNANLIFNTNNTEVARFTSTGLLGVNNSNPSAQLDVGGSINSTNFYMAGKNFLLNGAFDYWQRGVAFSGSGYTADRWFQYGNDSITRQSFTAASPEIPNGVYYLRYQATQAGAYHYIQQNIENGHNDLSGKTVTISFWARSNTGSSGTLSILTALNNDTQLYSANLNTTTAWVKYYVTFNIATLNFAASYRYFRMGGVGDGGGADIAQVQYEIGSAPTPFSRAGGNLTSELQACQKHFVALPYNNGAARANSYSDFLIMNAMDQTTWARGVYNPPVPMRAVPVLEATPTASNYYLLSSSGVLSVTSISLDTETTASSVVINAYRAVTAGATYYLRFAGNTTDFLRLSADL